MSGLSVRNVSLKVGAKQILNTVSVDLKKGEMVGLVGPNGAGKSSLLKCILGLSELTEGEVLLEGENLQNIPLKERAKKLAYAAQGAPVHWPLHAEYVVGLGRVPHLSPLRPMSQDDKLHVERALEMTDSVHLRDRSVTTLSGGERARVLLARALASDTAYIFADEPIASLDPAHQLHVMNILKEQSKAGKGVMVVLHDLNLACRYCDRLVLLNEGLLIDQGAPEMVLSDKNLSDVFGVNALRLQDKLIIQNLVERAT